MTDSNFDDTVILYTVPACPLCRQARITLAELGVSFDERDLSSDYAALRRMFRLTRQKLVPVLEYRGKAVVRPQLEEIKTLLG